MDLPTTIAWTTRLMCVGAAITTLELLAVRSHFADGGLYSWRVMRSRPLVLRSRPLRRVLDLTLDEPWFSVLLVLRVAALLTLVWQPSGGPLTTAALAIVLAATLLFNLRSAFGQDGSDQMTTQIVLVLLLASLSPKVLGPICMIYLCVQACLSYFVAGVAKAAGTTWRKGSAVFLIFNTATYGVPAVAQRLAAAPQLTKVLTWSVVAIEVLFPLTVWLGGEWLALALLWGVTFHALNAVIMGLNSFFWAFLASYPAIVFVSQMLTS